MPADAPSDRDLQILAVVARIPPGRVATYGQIAALADLPGRARLVGHILQHCPLSKDVPWHRVVNATGGISPRRSGTLRQRRLLEAEGIQVAPNDRIDLLNYGWTRQSPG